jgi:hypothetical protein
MRALRCLGPLLALALCALPCPALDGLDPAVAAYRDGDHATARALWTARYDELADDAAGEKGRVAYDLGNVAFREGRTLEAVGWYTLALEHRPRDGDTWANLEHARREAGLDPADRGDLDATVRRVLSAWTTAESERWLLALTALLALALAGEALRGGRVWRRTALVLGVAVALSAVPWVFGLARAGGDPLLVIDERPVALRSEPRPDGAQIGRLDPGATVERSDALPGWVEVRETDGAQGWVPREAVFALRR